MPIIARKIIKKTRVSRRCEAALGCLHGGRLPKGSEALRLYGYAELGDMPYAIYMHPECECRGLATRPTHLPPP